MSETVAGALVSWWIQSKKIISAEDEFNDITPENWKTEEFVINFLRNLILHVFYFMIYR